MVCNTGFPVEFSRCLPVKEEDLFHGPIEFQSIINV